MNFDRSLKAAMPAATEPLGLTSEISQRVSHFAHRRHLQRRVFACVGATVAAFVTFALYPTLSAQAALTRITGALEGVERLVARRFTVDEHGDRVLAGVVAYDHGKWRIERSKGQDVILYANGHRYRYDSYTNSYVVESTGGPFAHNNGLSLSDMLKDMSAWHNNVTLRDATLDGKPVVEATITSEILPERTIVFADGKTNLPIRAYGDSLENGAWRRTTVMDFDYGASTDATRFLPDARLPQVSKEAWEHNVVARMLTNTVAKFSLRKGDLVLRSLDVASDGSVFIAFQSGQARTGGWTGYGFTLADDLGTTYTQLQMLDSSDSPFYSISRKDGGRIEFAVFVPTTKLPGFSPRSLTLGAHIDANGNFVRLVEMQMTFPDGHSETKWQVNRWGEDESMLYKNKTILVRTIKEPTCTDRPAYMTVVGHGEWNDTLLSDLTKAGARSNYFLGTRDRPQAEFWLHEQLRLMAKIESEGGGPYSRDGVTKSLGSLDSAAVK
jgi:hypothetical protein